ncbi:MAG: YmdB family metallophosphoesterase [Holosporales bacterium]|jgi:metallophosphoesterase (TIGR00282 family)|nr:YmdB family metallophosphoesterase [Holosporales bacterium]
MKIVFFGDVVGKAGRTALASYIKIRKGPCQIDCAIANGENASHGFGIRQNICDMLFEAGIDVITLGNHSFDQKDDLQMFDREKRLIRPLNYPKGTPGHGFYVHEIVNLGKKVLVVNLMGRVFMEQNDDPFAAMAYLLQIYKLGKNIDAIVVDIHAEITAEKVALARMFDGKISAVIGTHTHVPTADAMILKGGTALLTDAGMCGDYNSVIGMEDEGPFKRFVDKVNMFAKMSPASGGATVCGALFDIDNATGLATDIKTIRNGGFLKEQQDIV